MKDQVSVDNLTVTIKASDKVCLTMPGYMQIEIDEYKRLKRLDENVNQLFRTLDDKLQRRIELFGNEHPTVKDLQGFMTLTKTVLKSLYDENTQES
jgi:hypothetical protein